MLARWRRRTSPRRWPEGVVVADGSSFAAPVHLGEYTRFNGPTHMRGAGSIHVGRYGAIGRDLVVISQNHRTSGPNLQGALERSMGLKSSMAPAPVAIGNNVWIGDRVTVLPGAVVGDGAVVAAGAVVTRRGVPPFAIAGGVPANVISMRFSDEMRDLLAELAWWDWPRSRILANASFFALDLETCSVADVRAAIVQ